MNNAPERSACTASSSGAPSSLTAAEPCHPARPAHIASPACRGRTLGKGPGGKSAEGHRQPKRTLGA
jgi:hypothetical protein